MVYRCDMALKAAGEINSCKVVDPPKIEIQTNLTS